MDYQEFTADLRCPTIVCSSVEENEETLAVFDIDQRVRQLGKGEFKSHMAVRTVGDTEFFADRFNTALSLYLGSPKGLVGFLFPRSVSGRFLAAGENIREDKLLFVTEGSGADIIIPPLSGSEDIALTPERLAERMAALCPTIDVPELTTIYEGDPAKLRVIRKNIVELVSHPEKPYSEEAVANLVDMTVAWLGESAPYWGPDSMTVNPIRTQIARKAQEYLEENYDCCIRLEDLCRETGVGVRSLQRSFREHFDVTVTQYLKDKRLDAVRRDLSESHPKSTTVTEVALRHGFGHLGRFSVEFKQRFGESPCETLATREDQKSAAKEIPASAFLASAELISTFKDD